MSDDVSYNGWFVNLFTKEGRAENKEERADRLRSKAKGTSGKRRAKLEQRADANDIRAAELTAGDDIVAIGPKHAKALWNEDFPWAARPPNSWYQQPNESLRLADQADGSKPTDTAINLEHRATILGGIAALQRAVNRSTSRVGYAPFEGAHIDDVPALLDTASYDRQLIEAVQDAAEQLGRKKPTTLRDAAELVRRVVREQGLQEVAWSLRALLIMESAGAEHEDDAKRNAKVSRVIGGIVGGAAGYFLGVPKKGAAAGAAAAEAGQSFVAGRVQENLRASAKYYAAKVKEALLDVEREVAARDEHLARMKQAEDQRLARQAQAELDEQREEEALEAAQRVNVLMLLGALTVVGGAVYYFHHRSQDR